MGLIDAATNLVFGKPEVKDFRIDRIDQAKILWYQWANELGTDPNTAFNISSPVSISSPASELSKSRSYDISNHIASFSYSKNMGTAGGSFQLVLENSFDWSRHMKPGQWLCAFLTGDGKLGLPAEGGGSNSFDIPGLGSLAELAAGALGSTSLQATPALPLPPGPPSSVVQTMKPKQRCLGIIQRVGVRSMTTADGTVDITYVVTGKDYGTIYEDTEIWFNANNADAAAFDAVIHSISTKFTKNLTELLRQYHNIFLNPNDVLKKNMTSVSAFFPEQWVLPDRLVKDLGLKLNSEGKGLFGDITSLTEFNATIFENPQPQPFAGLQGRCWEKLKSLSQPEYHELFTELSDAGNPKIIFRPIPWALDKSRYPTLGKLMLSYKDLTDPTGAPPPLPVGSIAGTFKSSGALSSALEATAAGEPDDDVRTIHAIPLTAMEVEGFDVGPDYHSRANFFLVDTMTAMKNQNNAFALMAKVPVPPFPFRDENDIKRHGFRPLLVNINSFLVSNQQLFGNEAQKTFMLEANEVMRDFYANAEDFYSGTINLSAGSNDVRLGKVFVTDGSFQAIDNMVFYIEGYTDTYTVNADGVGSWTQSVTVTRGMSYEVLTGKSPKDKAPTKSGTFHVHQNAAGGDDSILGTVKSFLK